MRSGHVVMAALTFALLSSSALAQSRRGPSQDELKTRLETKLKAPFFKLANWITDYDQAREEAARSGKLIFGYFSRSYAH